MIEKDQQFASAMVSTKDYSGFEAGFRERMIWYSWKTWANTKSPFEEPKLSEYQPKILEVLQNRVTISVGQKERLILNFGNFCVGKVIKKSLIIDVNNDLEYCI